MAITKITSPATPNPVTAGAGGDWELMLNHLAALKLVLNNHPFILTHSDDTTIPDIKQGSYVQFGGSLYIVDTADYAITGTPVNGNNYIRISGTTTLTAEWIQDISSYVWNEVYGYKYTGSYAILPYLVVKDGTSYDKYSLIHQNKRITGDLSVSGNATVGGTFGVTGALSALNYNCRTLAGNTDLNTVIVAGFYRLADNNTNAPTGSNHGQMIVLHGGGDTIAQIIIPYNYDKLWYRSGNPPDVGGPGTWKNWKTLTQTDQDLRTTDSPTFANATISGHNVDTQLDRINQDVKDTASPAFTGISIQNSTLTRVARLTPNGVIATNYTQRYFEYSGDRTESVWYYWLFNFIDGGESLLMSGFYKDSGDNINFVTRAVGVGSTSYDIHWFRPDGTMGVTTVVKDDTTLMSKVVHICVG